MRELLERTGGEPMTVADYLADYERHFWSTGSPGCWKLQRRQHPREPGCASWQAFARGDREESLRLLEADRDNIAAEHQRIDELGLTVQWVRVVEEPLTPYVQWELHLLRLHERCGSRVRVVRSRQVRALEAAGPLPEIHTLGTEVMYRIRYDDRGMVAGVRRYTDRELIARCQRVLVDLHACGEPPGDYVAQEVASPAPGVTVAYPSPPVTALVRRRYPHATSGDGWAGRTDSR